ncbi:PI-PLC domain-containing protein [Neolewinella aquimaris]|uniref:hypothetical protein n=1 Tax=Neolewinella aquimaris TaxID=1835722 RepID=UPI0016079FE4|nr:hypothetical protein [Neolewinella aquimaris]
MSTRTSQSLRTAALLLVLCLLLCTAAQAQPDANGVWQYNEELEGHHCDDAGCYAFCTSSYLENSNSANNSEPSAALQSAVADWMKHIPDTMKMNGLSIPGTHDSGAQWGGTAAETQSWDIKQQLSGGIRFFDIRLKPNPDDPNGLAVYHGDFPQCEDTDCFGACGLTCDRLTFTQILNWMNTFLKDHPTEAIIMEVKYEEGPTDASISDTQRIEWARRFNGILFDESNKQAGIQFNSDTFRFPGLIYNLDTTIQGNFNATMPTLDDLRGKIWIYQISDVAKTWYSNNIPINQFIRNISRQNNYTESAATLGNHVINYIKSARGSIGAGNWVQNWTNGINLLTPAIPVPADVASYVNKDAFHALNEFDNASVGTMVMDFPGEGLIYRIIKRNFPHNKLVDLTVAIDCHHSLLTGGASESDISVTLYNGGYLMGAVAHPAGCSGLGDAFYQVKTIMRAMPQEYTHLLVQNQNPKPGDGLGIDEIYVNQTRYGLGCYNGGVVDDELEKWGQDGGDLWCAGADGDAEYGADVICNTSWNFVSGVPGGSAGAYNLPAELKQEILDYSLRCTPLEKQHYTVKGRSSIPPLPTAFCGPNAAIVWDVDSTLNENYTLVSLGGLTVTAGTVITIPRGRTVTINKGTTFENNGTIINNGRLIVNTGGTLKNTGIINSTGQFFNLGTTVNAGEIYNPVGSYGQGLGGKQTTVNEVIPGYLLGPANTDGGRIVCEDYLNGQWVSNACTLDNFWLQEDRTLKVGEEVTLNITGLLSSYGIVNNAGEVKGTINNCGAYAGAVPSPGKLLDCEESEDASMCKQRLGGQWDESVQTCYVNTDTTISAPLTIAAGVTYRINAPVLISSTIVNMGTIDNYSVIDNSFTGTIDNYGSINMNHDSDGFGSIILCDGIIQNFADFHNIQGYGNGGIRGSGFFDNLCGAKFTGSQPLGVRFYNQPMPETVPPLVFAKNVTIQLDTSGRASINPANVDNGSYDKCTAREDLVLHLSKSTFSCEDLGTNTATFTVTDENGNVASTEVQVTVEDKEQPRIKSQEDMFVIALNAAGRASIEPMDVYSGAEDPCGIASYVLDQTDFSWCDIGSQSLTLTVVDNAGNQSSASVAVTVENTFLPQLTATQILTCGTTGAIEVAVQNADDRYSFDNGLTFAEANKKTGLEAGTYGVVVQNAAGCNSVSTTATITFPDADNDGVCDETTSTRNELVAKPKPGFYPIPMANALHIETNDISTGMYTLIILDITGREILSHEVDVKGTEGHHEVDVTQVVPGMYTVMLRKADALFTAKIIK